MNFVRPEAAAAIGRWREVIVSIGVFGFGLWLATLGGPVMLGLGAAICAVALTLALIARRRMRFHIAIDAPGVVDVDEGQISYMGPIVGGSVDLVELVEIEVLDVAGGRRCWRLRQADGQALLVPFAASGADRLYDHFATLPGAAASDLLSALEGPADTARRVWAKPGSGLNVVPR